MARAIAIAEDRKLFGEAMARIGLAVAAGRHRRELRRSARDRRAHGFPAIIRPSFTLGGTGGGIAYNREEFEHIVRNGLDLSPTTQVLVERSVIGWKEFELEVMRDHEDNVVIVCSIENLDPMGVHTGDSITVAPAMTLTDREYQTMRDAAVAIIREVGVDAGGCNIQFAVNPRDGEMLVIEMNPRVSRSSALASKATGFPIARIGAKLAVGYRLDEIPNDITKTTPASFEPVLDYVVVKMSALRVREIPVANPYLTTQMKSVGESMAIGRTFKEAFQKGLRALETGRPGWAIAPRLHRRPARRRFARDAARRAAPADAGADLPGQARARARLVVGGGLRAHRQSIRGSSSRCRSWSTPKREYAALADVGRRTMLRRMKRMGFSDRQLGALRDETEDARARSAAGRSSVRPAYKMVDTCAGEFPSATPYLYGSYDEESEAPRTGRRSVVILGSGPNRIGQGVEFDYCCVRAVMALRERGFETIMINSNPETVSTDFDTSDKLYFEPLTFEDVLEIVRARAAGRRDRAARRTDAAQAHARARGGGRENPRNVARRDRHRRRSPAIRQDRARARHLTQPPNGTATSVEEAVEVAERIGYPVLVRPSYVLGGRAMQIVYDARVAARVFRARRRACRKSGRCSSTASSRTRSSATSMRSPTASVSSSAASCSTSKMPASTPAIRRACCRRISSAKRTCRRCASRRSRSRRRSASSGLINVQYAIKDGVVYVLEVNPRAQPHDSVRVEGDRRSARVARRARDGRARRSRDIGFTEEIDAAVRLGEGGGVSVQQVPGTDPVLGPEMRSTGEVHGHLRLVRLRVRESRSSRRRNGLPARGHGARSPSIDSDKPTVTPIARRFHEMGFEIVATSGTADVSARARHSGAHGPQGARGTAELSRHDRESTTSACSSTRRWASTRSATTTAAPGRDRASRVVHDDDVRRERGLRRDSLAAFAPAASAGRCRNGRRRLEPSTVAGRRRTR